MPEVDDELEWLIWYESFKDFARHDICDSEVNLDFLNVVPIDEDVDTTLAL